MSNNLIDLHLHTCYSDGELTPDELIKLAQKSKIKVIAITDHDTILGLKNITYKSTFTHVIKGIELSAKVDKGRMHILGYNIDVNNDELNKKMNELRDNSLHTILSLMEQIKNDHNIRFGYDDIKDLINSNKNLGRPELARLCVKNGYASNIQDAFDKYLISSYDKIKKSNKGLTYKQCIELIINSGGIPVLAHPKTLLLDEKKLTSLIKDMIKYGLKGIEVYHSSHSKEESDLYLKIANKFNLLISGGSDYHGPFVKPEIDIGHGKNNNLALTSLSILDNIFIE